MQQQERDYLLQFLTQLREARLAEKDAEADELIKQAVAKQPDAAYLLVQRALLTEQALEAVKAKNAQLLQALQKANPENPTQTSFLGKNNPWATQAVTAGQSAVPGVGAYQTSAAAAPITHPSPVPSFLSSVATTAVGVAAGSFLFQGIENLLGHHGSSGSLWLGGNAPEHVSETVINNYYAADTDAAAALPDNSTASLVSDNSDADFISDDDNGFMSSDDDSTWI